MIDDYEVYDYDDAVWLGVILVEQTAEMTGGIPVPAGTKVALEMTIDGRWEAEVPKGVAAPIGRFDFFIDESHFEIIEEYPQYDTNCRICGSGAALCGCYGDITIHRCKGVCGATLPTMGLYPSYDPNMPIKESADEQD